MAAAARQPRRRGNQPVVPQRESELPSSMLHPDLRPHDPDHLQHHLSFSTFMARAVHQLTQVRMHYVAYRGHPGDVLGLGSSFGVAAFPNQRISSTLPTSVHEVVTKSPEKAENANEWESRLHATLCEVRVLTAKSLSSHPNIVQLIEFAWRDARYPLGVIYPALILEKAPFGTLMDFQQPKNFNLRYGTKVEICRDIAAGLAFLHACGVIHGDIKPENILIFPHGSNYSRLRAKLSDFSHSVFEADAEDQRLSWRGCTPQWAAPEVMVQDSQTVDLIYRSDVFSFGLVFAHVMLEQDQNGPLRPDTAHSSNDILIMSSIEAASQEPKDIDIRLFKQVLEMTLSLDVESRTSRMDEVMEVLKQGLLRAHQCQKQDTMRSSSSSGILADSTDDLKYSDESSAATEISTPRKISWAIQRMTEVFDVNEACVALQLLPKAVQLQIHDGLYYNLFMGLPQDQFSETLLQMSVCYIAGFGTKANVEIGLSYLIAASKAQSYRAMAVLCQIHAACQKTLPEAELFADSGHLHLTGSIFSPERCLLEGSRTLSTIALANAYDGPMESEAMQLYRSSQNRRKGLETSGVAHMFDIEDADRLESQIQDIFGGLPVVTLDQDGYSLLHFAAAAGQFRSVQTLLEHQAIPDLPNFQGETPLFVAMRDAELEVALLLLSHGADPLHPTKDNCTPLHFLGAFRGAELDLLVETLRESEVLLTADINVDCSKFEAVGWHYYVSLALGTPLHWAMNRRNIEAARYLLELGADPLKENARQCSPLYYSLVDNMHQFVQLFAEGCEPWTSRVREDLRANAIEYSMNIMGANNFQLMVINGEEYPDSRRKTMDVVQRLVAPVDISGPLFWAAANKNCLNEAKYLLANHPIKVDDFRSMNPPQTAIQRAVQHGDREMFDLLLENGADVTITYERESMTYLHLLCGNLITEEDMIYFASRMIDKGANINAADSRGFKPLWLSLVAGRLALAEAMYDHGGDFSGVTNEGLTAIGFLIVKASPALPEIFEFFFARCKQDPQALLIGDEIRRGSVLHLANHTVSDNNDPLVKSLQMRLLSRDLFGKREYLDYQDAGGQTALHVSAKYGHSTLVRLLLEAGADAGLSDIDGHTAIDLAKSRRGSNEWERLCMSFEGGGAGRGAVERFERDTELTVAVLEAWR